MLNYNKLPEHIRKIAEEYDPSSNRIDCLPSKFHYNGQNYYVISYYPTLQDLFIREDGSVPAYEEVKRATLIIHVYKTAGSTIIKTGGSWAMSPSAKLYRKWEQILISLNNKLEDTAPAEILDNLTRCLKTALKLREYQDVIFKSVEEGTDLVTKANDTEIVTEDIQKKVRACVVDMVRAAVRKNEEQLKTEGDRKQVLAYLESIRFKKPSIILDYHWFKKNEPHMLSSRSETAEDMEELKAMVKEEKTVDEMDNPEEFYKLLLNPK
ncbi:hypothetical protein [Bacillus infantis]|uniref:hypothetical protein n=1 Tax=Bacillus infantis TaxID=324767 RepID=UPI003CE75A84